MFKTLALAALTFTAANARIERQLGPQDGGQTCDNACDRVTVDETRYAVCHVIDPSNVYGTTGDITFAQTQTTTTWTKDGGECPLWKCQGETTETTGLTIDASVQGLTEGKHGFHVHTFGAVNDTCGDAKGHFNPTGVNHAAWDAPSRHDGCLR